MDKRLILDKIKIHYNLSTNRELARFLGVSSQVVSNWYNRNTYNACTLLSKCLNISPQWLLTGSGEMFVSIENKQLAHSESLCKLDPFENELISSKDELIKVQRELISILEQRIKELECWFPHSIPNTFPPANPSASQAVYQHKTTK